MRSKHSATLLLTTTLLVTTVGVMPSSGQAAAAPQRVCDALDVVDAPQINPPGARMTFPPDLSAVSRDDVWFAFDQGGYGDGSASAGSRPWPLRWDGRSVESAPPIPQPRTAGGDSFWFSETAATLGGQLSVSFDSAEHGWLLSNASALGNPNSQGAPVGYRWHDGRWTMTPLAVSPQPRLYVNDPHDVVSLSPDNAWAVGSRWRPHLDGGQAGSHGAHIEHWDGTRWSVVDNPLSDQRGVHLRALEVVSATEIWAVGGYDRSMAIEPVAMRWDGRNWSTVSTPAPAGSMLDDVSVTGSGEVWAVGRQYDDDGQLGAVPLIMRWDGGEWTVEADLPDLPGVFYDAGDSWTPGVYAASATDVWVAVNLRVDHVPATVAQNVRAVFLHWDGSTWRTVATPGPEQYGTGHVIDEIDGTGSDNIWVAGRSYGRELTMAPVVYRLSCDRPGGGS